MLITRNKLCVYSVVVTTDHYDVFNDDDDNKYNSKLRTSSCAIG